MQECPQCGRKEESELVEHICSKCDLAFDASTFVARLHLRRWNIWLYMVVVGFVVLYISEWVFEQDSSAFKPPVEALLVFLAVLQFILSWFCRKSVIVIAHDYMRIVHPDFGGMDIRYERIGRVEVSERPNNAGQMTIYGTDGEQLLRLDGDQLRGLTFTIECAIEIERRLDAWRDRNDSSR